MSDAACHSLVSGFFEVFILKKDQAKEHGCNEEIPKIYID
jgi:hypothetical protein